MLAMPPRHGKTEITKAFGAWMLGRNPRRKIITVGYNSAPAEKISDRIRKDFNSPIFQRIFPDARLRHDRRALDFWETTEGGSLLAAGVGGSVTGEGANLILGDDLIRGQQDARSETVRERTWQFWTSDLMSRREGDEDGGMAAVVLTNTRWHWDDPMGRELDLWPERWKVISLPAFANAEDPLGREEGEPLWPQRYAADYLNEQRTLLSPSMFSALYQQNPTPDEGDFFLREDIRWYEQKPKIETLRIFGASDWATTHGDGDYTVHVVAGLDPDDNLFVLDMWRAQVSTDVAVDALIDLIQKWKPRDWGDESSLIDKAVGPFRDRRMKERKVWVRFESFPAGADKPTRAQAIRGRMAQGKVYFPTGAPWRSEFENELLTFPNGVHDDMVDALGLLGRMLDKQPHRDSSRKQRPRRQAYNPLDYGRADYSPI